MLSELRGQIVALAVAAAQKLITENLDERRQRALVDEFFSCVRNGSLTVLDGGSLGPGQAAEVTSALPLTDDEQRVIRGEILSHLGTAASISFRVDPTILGGLVIRVGDRVVDGSVSGRLEDLKQSMR
jgi:F-type H+-transporting ATPase subunit b